MEFIPSCQSKGRPKSSRGGPVKFNKTRLPAKKRSNPNEEEEAQMEKRRKTDDSNDIETTKVPKKRGQPPDGCLEANGCDPLKHK